MNKKPDIDDYNYCYACKPGCDECAEALDRFQKDLTAWNYQQERKDTKNDKFWMVVGPLNCPMVRHGTQEVAEAEANRLATKQPEGEFYVVQAVYKALAYVSITSEVIR